jgi:hypothetical protein
MMMIIAVAWLALAHRVPPPSIPVEVRSDCPFEQMVGRVEQITGDAMGAQILRTGHPIAVTEHACILYGDQVTAGLGTTLVIDTAVGQQHVGGIYDSVWTVPPAREQATQSASALLTTIFHGLLEPSRRLTTTTASRGPAACRDTGHPPPLATLDRLVETEQRIGADLRGIAVGWHPLAAPADVRARLLGVNGALVAAVACGDAPIILPLAAGMLRPGGHLLLEVSDGTGTNVSYRLTVLDPGRLPAPPLRFPEDWQTAAWRLASGPPNTRLDSISRLVFAPREAFGARLILDAVWAEGPF